MPEMDGLDATIAIRARSETGGRRVPIIAMTAHALPTDRDRCLAAGMDAYISKPVIRRDLIETVERLGNAARARTGFKSTETEFVLPANPDQVRGMTNMPISQTDMSNGSLSVFNLERALELVGGEESLFRDMASYFFRDGLKVIQEIDAAVQTRDAKVIDWKADFL